MASLADEFRPTSLDQVVGQPRAVQAITTTLKRGWGGRAWYIIGQRGQGKTTIGRIIAEIGADELAIKELDANRMNPAKIAEQVESYASRCLFGKGGKAFIVNEAHKLPHHAVVELLTALEPPGGLPAHICWVFTAPALMQPTLFVDDDAKDRETLVSRCQRIVLEDTPESRLAMARRAKAVAMEAGVDGLPEELYLHALNNCDGNLRALLQRVESGQLADEAKAHAMAYLTRPLAEQDAHTRATMQAVLKSP